VPRSQGAAATKLAARVSVDQARLEESLRRRRLTACPPDVEGWFAEGSPSEQELESAQQEVQCLLMTAGDCAQEL
jgi:hypothetical protein